MDADSTLVAVTRWQCERGDKVRECVGLALDTLSEVAP